MLWISVFPLFYILQTDPSSIPNIGHMQQSLLRQETAKIERQLAEIDLALEVLEAEEINDEQIHAMQSFGENSRIHIAQVAAEIRRKFDDDPEYLQSREARTQLRVLAYRLERAQIQLGMAIQNIRQNLRNQNLEHSILAKTYSDLAILDLRRGSSWVEALQSLQLWVNSTPSLSEGQLQSVLDAYHSFYSAVLQRHHEREKQVAFLLGLLDEFQAEALDTELRRWLLRPSQQLQQARQQPDEEASLEQRLQKALASGEDLRGIVHQEKESLASIKENLRKSIEDTSRLAAELAKENPQVIYDILIKDLAFDEE